MTSNLNIGVDGGGTKTRAVVVDDALRVLGRGEAGSSNHYSVGVERAIENVVIAIEEAIAGASIEFSDVTSCGLGTRRSLHKDRNNKPSHMHWRLLQRACES
jgi:N-acetylglucosamine kinase-like BadF-type ATPase